MGIPGGLGAACKVSQGSHGSKELEPLKMGFPMVFLHLSDLHLPKNPRGLGICFRLAQDQMSAFSTEPLSPHQNSP